MIHSTVAQYSVGGGEESVVDIEIEASMLEPHFDLVVPILVFSIQQVPAAALHTVLTVIRGLVFVPRAIEAETDVWLCELVISARAQANLHPVCTGHLAELESISGFTIG